MTCHEAPRLWRGLRVFVDMFQLRKPLVFAFFLAMLCGMAEAQRMRHPSDPWPEKSFHTTTQWVVSPSLKYDALCALDMLSGDPFYLKFYRDDYNRLAPRLTPQEKNDFVAIKRIIKDKNKGIVSADLALILSVEAGDMLDDILIALDKPNEIGERLQATPYYSEPNFSEFMQVRPHLIAAIRALKRIGFDDDWNQHVRSQILARMSHLQPELARYNIVPVQEQVLGHRLPDNRIQVYLLYYFEPHGIKITGTRFLTHVSYPSDIVLHNAVHEMMHPPYSLDDPKTREAVEALRHEPFLMDKVLRHNPSFGYNEFEGFVEEDCVQALEQTLTQSMGLEDDEQEYWRIQDAGMHVLAIALYELMEHGKFLQRERFSTFFQRMVFTGELSNARLIELNRKFWSEPNGARLPRQ